MNFGGSQGRMGGYKRARVMSGIANYMRAKNSASTAWRSAQLMRRIGAPSQVHSFSRPGQRIAIGQTPGGGTLLQLGGSGGGMTFAAPTAGNVNNTNTHCFSQVFAFNLLTAAADLAGLYDNFRIKSVTVKFDLSFNSTPATRDTTNGIQAASLPLLHYAIDPDDNRPPADVNGVLEYSKSRSLRLGDKSVSFTFTPRANGVVSQTALVPSPGTGFTAAVGSMLPSNTWLDCQNAQTVSHYGVKYCLEDMPTSLSAPAYSWVLYCTPVYNLEMKNTH